MDGERLIEAVRSFPCLWNVSSKGYKDLRARENAWKEVTVEVRKVLHTHQLASYNSLPFYCFSGLVFCCRSSVRCLAVYYCLA